MNGRIDPARIVAAKLQKAPKVEMVEYRRAHYYRAAGFPNPSEKSGLWPSVTTILGAGVPKPALVGWARKDAIEQLRVAAKHYDIGAFADQTLWSLQLETVIQLASEKSDTPDAATYGVAAHDLIARWCKSGQEPPSDHLGIESYRAFRSWLAQSGQIVAASEMPVFHDGIAGTIDLLLNDGYGTWTVADIKTGKGVYPEYSFQASAYARAVSGYLDLGVQQAIVLHLPSEPRDGEPAFAAYKVQDMATAYMGYAAAAAMRAALQSTKLEPISTDPEATGGK